jgi:hypothetical protein
MRDMQMKQVLDQQAAEHQRATKQPPGRMDERERAYNAALLRNLQEKLNIRLSNHEALAASAAKSHSARVPHSARSATLSSARQ